MSEENWRMLNFAVQVISTIGTFFVAFVALRTSRNAKQAYMIDQRPYIAFDNIASRFFRKGDEKILTPTLINMDDSVQIGIVLKNVGKTIGYYKVKSINVSIDAKTNNSGKFNSKDGLIYPGMFSIYYAPV